jgi:GxxExxY protein
MESNNLLFKATKMTYTLEESKKNFLNLTDLVIQSAIAVHTELGPGLQKSVYLDCLEFEIKNKGLTTKINHTIALNYKGLEFKDALNIDLLVNDLLVLEIINHPQPIELTSSYLISKLKVGNYPVGLVINFNEKLIKNGLKRIQL